MRKQFVVDRTDWCVSCAEALPDISIVRTQPNARTGNPCLSFDVVGSASAVNAGEAEEAERGQGVARGELLFDAIDFLRDEAAKPVNGRAKGQIVKGGQGVAKVHVLPPALQGRAADADLLGDIVPPLTENEQANGKLLPVAQLL